MISLMRLQDVVSNNLANAATAGFKRDGISFNEALERDLAADGGRGRSLGSLGVGATPKQEYTDLTVGTISTTNNPLDMAINGPTGFFGVLTPAGVRYTRDGSFTLDSTGVLTTRDGFPVLDYRSQPIAIGNGKVVVESDGTIFVDSRQVSQVGIFDGPVKKEGKNLFASQGDVLPLVQTQRSNVVQGALEGSNVNAIESMIDMIRINRTFEMSQKSIQTQDDLTQRLIQSLDNRG